MRGKRSYSLQLYIWYFMYLVHSVKDISHIDKTIYLLQVSSSRPDLSGFDDDDKVCSHGYSQVFSRI